MFWNGSWRRVLSACQATGALVHSTALRLCSPVLDSRQHPEGQVCDSAGSVGSSLDALSMELCCRAPLPGLLVVLGILLVVIVTQFMPPSDLWTEVTLLLWPLLLAFYISTAP